MDISVDRILIFVCLALLILSGGCYFILWVCNLGIKVDAFRQIKTGYTLKLDDVVNVGN